MYVRASAQIGREMMKNRNESVLLYLHENGEREMKIKALLVRQGIRMKLITEEMQGQTLGYLLSLPDFSEQTVEEPNIAFEEDIMVLKGFTRERLNELLEGFRKLGIRKINLKAVVTEHNISWKLRDLYEELKDEHKQLMDMAKKAVENKKNLSETTTESQ